MPRRNHRKNTQTSRTLAQRRAAAGAPVPAMTPDQMAASLVERGLASPLVLGHVPSYRKRERKENRWTT